MGIFDKVSELVQGEQGQNLLNKFGGNNQNESANTGSRDESAVKRDDQQSFGGPTSGFDSTSERYTSGSSSSSSAGQGEPASFGGASTGFGGTSSRYTDAGSGAGGRGSADEGAGKDDSDEWEDDDPRSALRRRASEQAYSSSRGDFTASGAEYGSTATPHYGAAEAGDDGAFLEPERTDDRAAADVQRNDPFGEGSDEQPGYERGSDEKRDSSYGGGDRGIDFVASGGASAYADGLNEFGGAGRNNDGEGRCELSPLHKPEHEIDDVYVSSSYQPDFPDQRDGRRDGERDNYP
ncbi:hypothetical protein JCM3770_000722 [Rhodotorula araucariae]